MNVKATKALSSLKSILVRKSPEILTGLGIAGMASAIFMGVKATPKALRLVMEYEDETGEYARKRDYVKVAWKCYIPTVLTFGFSTACLIGASSVNLKRNAALATAYSLSESALREYQEKVVETIGDKKEKLLRDQIAQDKIDKEESVPGKEVIILEKEGTLCKDSLTGRWFKSDIETLKKAVNELNRQMRDNDMILLNDFYYEIGLDQVAVGDILGWSIEKGYIDIDFSSCLSKEKVPCLVINYTMEPYYIK